VTILALRIAVTGGLSAKASPHTDRNAARNLDIVVMLIELGRSICRFGYRPKRYRPIWLAAVPDLVWL
jgi:hypothetical protein